MSISELWLVALKPIISEALGSVFWLRIIALFELTILGIVVMLVFIRPDIARKHIFKDEYREHDKFVFHKSDDILHERDLSYFLSNLINDHSYRYDSAKYIDRFIYYFNDQSNQFLIPEISEANQRLLKSLELLMRFCSTNFDEYPAMQSFENYRLCMRPDLNIDRGGEYYSGMISEYDALGDALETHVVDVRTAYNAYRKNVKKLLFI